MNRGYELPHPETCVVAATASAIANICPERRHGWSPVNLLFSALSAAVRAGQSAEKTSSIRSWLQLTRKTHKPAGGMHPLT
jgi:hypothetical protein